MCPRGHLGSDLQPLLGRASFIDRILTNISSRCHVLPRLRPDAFAHRANPAPNLSHQQRIVSYVTTTPRSSNSSSMSRRLKLNRKYHRTAQLMTTAGKRWP